MKTLTSLLLIVPLFSILTVQTVRGQTEEEFTQEFQQYVNQHGVDATRVYVVARLAEMTSNAILEEAAWSILESSFGFSPCLGGKQRLCDAEFEAKMFEIATQSTIAAGACLAVSAGGGGPLAFVVCMAVVAMVHQQRLDAAEHAHRTCYLRARIECTPIPPMCPNAMETASRDIVPLLADCSEYDDPCMCLARSPIMIDVDGNGFDLTNVSEGVMFNITGFGREPLGWTRANSDDAFLALDLNANGFIDNGAELFGNFTAQPEPAAGAERNGFAALAVFDYNADGKIDSADSIYSELRLWQDRNHNGVSDPEEVQPLDKLGLKTLFLNYTRSERVDKFGNEFRFGARLEGFGDRQLESWAWDVFLVSSRPRRIPLDGGLQWATR
jgi:hypothetical protein